MVSQDWDSYWSNVDKSLIEKKIQKYKAEIGYKKLLEAVKEIKINGKVLEVGAGKAWISQILKAKGWQTTALDNNESVLKANSAFVNNYVLGDMYHLPFADKSFDLVISCGLLEHFSLKEVNKIVGEMKRAGKSVVAWLPTCGFEWKLFWFIRNLLGGHVVSKSYTHKKNDLEKLFYSLGFKTIKTGNVIFAGFLRYLFIYGTDNDS